MIPIYIILYIFTDHFYADFLYHFLVLFYPIIFPYSILIITLCFLPYVYKIKYNKIIEMYIYNIDINIWLIIKKNIYFI